MCIYMDIKFVFVYLVSFDRSTHNAQIVISFGLPYKWPYMNEIQNAQTNNIFTHNLYESRAFLFFSTNAFDLDLVIEWFLIL